MTTRKKIIGFSIGSLLIGFVLGVVVGGYGGIKISKKFNDLTNFEGIAYYALVVDQLYKSSDYQGAKTALTEFISFWDTYHGKEDDAFPENAYEWDTAIAYGRLGLLEERQGNQSESEAYFNKGVERLKGAGKDFSVERFKEFVSGMEKRKDP